MEERVAVEWAAEGRRRVGRWKGVERDREREKKNIAGDGNTR